ELNREGIRFITLRRRSEKMLREIYSQPDSAWQRISLPALTRIYRNPKVLENRVTLPGYEGELRQLTVMELGHEERNLRSRPVLPYRRALQHGRDESGFRYATDARGHFAVPHDGPAHRAGVQPLSGQNRLSQFVGS